MWTSVNRFFGRGPHFTDSTVSPLTDKTVRCQSRFMARRKGKSRSPISYEIRTKEGNTGGTGSHVSMGRDPIEAATAWATQHAEKSGNPPTDENGGYEDGAVSEVIVVYRREVAGTDGQPATTVEEETVVRLYANQVWQLSGLEASSGGEEPEMIDLGYEDGRAHRPSKYPSNDDYMKGYGLGRRSSVRRRPAKPATED